MGMSASPAGQSATHKSTNSGITIPHRLFTTRAFLRFVGLTNLLVRQSVFLALTNPSLVKNALFNTLFH
jgi:hypothetical protein